MPLVSFLEHEMTRYYGAVREVYCFVVSVVSMATLGSVAEKDS